MAERNSQELGIRVNETQRQPYAGGGRATVRDTDVQPRSDGLSQVLSGVLDVAAGIAERAHASNVQEEVVRGARARMAGEAEDAIESDAFAAPFARNGYRQQDYRLKQADFSLRMGRLLQGEGRSLSPEQFQKRMASEAAGILPSLDGLPPEARMQALMQQTKAEETLFTAHAQQHAGWLVEQGTKPFLAQGNSILAKLSAAEAGGDDLTYRAATEEAALYHMNLLNTPAIPDGQREKVAKQFLMGALDLNQRKVYEDLRDAGALDTMSFDDRRELNGAYERSRASTRAKESMTELERDATFQTGVESGAIGLEDASSYAKDRVQRGLWGAEQAINFVQNAQKGVANRQLMSNMVTSLEAGDVNTLNTLGFSVDEALTKYDQILAANGATQTQRLTSTTKLGLTLGAFPKTYGAAVGASVRAVLAAGDTVNPEMVATLNMVAEQVAVAEKTNPSAGNVLLQGIPEEQRGAMSFMLQQAKLGIEPGQALKEFGAQDLVATQQEEFQRFANSQKFQKALSGRVNTDFLSGTFGRIGNFLTGSSNLSDNTAVLAQYQRAVQDEALQLAGDRRNAGLLVSESGHEALIGLAAANVGERTIQVGKHGVLQDRERTPLILPRGVSVDQVFGTRDKLGVARELADRFPPDVTNIFGGNKSTVAFEYTRQGGLYRLQYDENGQELDRVKIDGNQIGAAVNKRNADNINAQRAADLGASVDVGGGTSLTIDGGNASGLQRRAVYDWRRDMLSHEGYRDTVYKDRNGLAVGVGRNVTGRMQEGQRITPEQAQQWFAEDTDNAIIAGSRIAMELGVTNQQAILGLAGAAFQLGESGLGQFKATKAAIRSKDWASFQKQVYDSAWAKQTPERVKAFLAYMQPHFTEMDTGPDWYSTATAR